jgi:hypothetical protein
MSVHIIYEVKLMLYSFLTGAALMITYDFFRISRIFIPHSYVFIGIEDMIYWVYAALVTFSLLYEQNDGGLRGYAIAGVFIGMFLYDRMVSRHLMKFLKYFREYLKIKTDSWERRKKQR